MRELIGDNERGLLVPIGNSDLLANGISWMYEHPVEARHLGEKAFQYVTENHSSQHHYQKLRSIYQAGF